MLKSKMKLDLFTAVLGKELYVFNGQGCLHECVQDSTVDYIKCMQNTYFTHHNFHKQNTFGFFI